MEIGGSGLVTSYKYTAESSRRVVTVGSNNGTSTDGG